MTKQQIAIIKALLANKIGIIPTDTIYGLVTLWENAAGITRIYALKMRSSKKPPVVLVANWEQAIKLGKITDAIVAWENKQSIPTTLIVKKTARGGKNQFRAVSTIALRVVRWPWLKAILMHTGPIVATSCNRSTETPKIAWSALTTWQQNVDFSYQTPFPMQTVPSRIYDWEKQRFVR